MSEHAYAHGGSESSHETDHGPGFYIKIWALLLVLLIVSILGPMFGHVWVTLITAFGIAVVKAGIVAAYFMHLNVEKKYIWYLLSTMLLLMVLMFMGIAPDVLKHTGQNWLNEASHNLKEQYKEGYYEEEGAGHHSEESVDHPEESSHH
jgi:caa(3)-type oxidase subunit IV